MAANSRCAAGKGGGRTVTSYPEKRKALDLANVLNGLYGGEVAVAEDGGGRSRSGGRGGATGGVVLAVLAEVVVG
jgi:hypothetical protein